MMKPHDHLPPTKEQKSYWSGQSIIQDVFPVSDKPADARNKMLSVWKDVLTQLNVLFQ